MKTLASQAAKSADKELARIQLDSLAALLENAHKMAVEDVEEAASSAVELIGNANARISRLSREKLVSSINKSLVKEDTDFMGIAPNFFGPEFSKRAKEFLDQVKSLRATVPGWRSFQETPFSKGPPLREGIGQGKGRRPQLLYQGEPRRETTPSVKPVTVVTHTLIDLFNCYGYSTLGHTRKPSWSAGP